MSETRKNLLTIDGGQVKEDDHVASYKAIPESDTDFRTSKASLQKSKEKLSADGAEEKLLQKEDEAKITTRVDMAEAKYVVGDHRNGDAKIELDANKRQFTGLTKEELMKYAEDPFWIRLRWFMFILFWALWLCMLAGAIAIIIRAPKCAPPPPRTWYEKGPLVDVSTMEDYSQVEEAFQQMENTQVSGIFAFGCKDSYEVLEDSMCLDSFKAFATKAKEYGVKVIVDLTANFVSTSHKWFQLSANLTAEYKDYFIWAKSDEYSPDDSATPIPPKFLLSTLNISAWTWNDMRKEFYLHQFGVDQPDLNFNNPVVVEQFDKVINKWMQAGAAGVRLQNARLILVNSSVEEESPRMGKGSKPGVDHTQYEYWLHRTTRDQPALDALLAHWSHLVAKHVPTVNETVFTIAERARPELFMLKHNTSSLRPPSAAPLRLRNLTAAAAQLNARFKLKRWPVLQLQVEGADADSELTAFAMLLPAAPLLTLEQLAEEENTTTIESLSHAVELRKDASVQHGEYVISAAPTANSTQTVLVCARWKAGHTGYVAAYNAGDEERYADLSALDSLPAALTKHRLPPALRDYPDYDIKAVKSNNVLVPPKTTVVFSYVPKTAVDH